MLVTPAPLSDKEVSYRKFRNRTGIIFLILIVILGRCWHQMVSFHRQLVEERSLNATLLVQDSIKTALKDFETDRAAFYRTMVNMGEIASDSETIYLQPVEDSLSQDVSRLKGIVERHPSQPNILQVQEETTAKEIEKDYLLSVPKKIRNREPIESDWI